MRTFLAAALAALLTLSLAACGAEPHVSSGSEAGKDAPDLEGLFTELSALCGEAAVDIDPATTAGLYGVEESEIVACRAAGGVSADEVTGRRRSWPSPRPGLPMRPRATPTTSRRRR